MKKVKEKTETVFLAAGCFWGVEEVFRTISGVLAIEVGYTGGKKESPTYEDVCSHTTGHAEAVKIVFDPARVPFEKLLEIFWERHDPTTLDRQGPDVGDQYRSAIFYTTEEQRSTAERSKGSAQKRFSRPIVTEITKAGPWWKAEEYHQQYVLKNGGAACHL